MSSDDSVINPTKNSSQTKEFKARPHNTMQEDIASLHTFLPSIQSTVTAIKNLQETHQNEVMVLSNLSVPALRNLETIAGDIQVNQNKISQNFANSVTFPGLYEKSISSLREEIQNAVALKGNEEKDNLILNLTLEISQLIYEQLSYDANQK